MAKKNRRIYTILGTAVGTGLAVYGIRQGMRWYQQRQSAYQDEVHYHGESAYRTGRYQPFDQPDREPIPATGPLPAASPLTGLTDAGVIDLDDPNTRQVSGTGTAYGETGFGSSARTGIVMDDYVAPLIEHAIAFNSVMNLLRSRQRDGEGNEGTESLTEGDRTSMRAVLDQMQEHVADYNEAALRSNPLAERSYHLTRKLRDALDNLDYSGSDLFRIFGEVRTDMCKLVHDLEDSGQVTITGLDQIRQLYNCV